MAARAKLRQAEKLQKTKDQSEKFEKEKLRIVKQRISGLQVILHPVKRRCVVTRRKFFKGDAICNYPGEWISLGKAKKREKIYDINPDQAGSFLFIVKVDGKYMGLDATSKSKFGHCIGRHVNHSRNPNVTPGVESHFGDGKTYLVLRANRDIEPGEEVHYDYDDNRPEIIRANAWLGKKKNV